jgi:tetratricopeptide (TPR) repeat protein
LYRDGSWQKAIVELEAAQKFRRGAVFNHAVLADCYRAIGNYSRVSELWTEMKDASPHPELLAEGRIVYAGSLADQGKFLEALAVMEKVPLQPRKVLEYHLRQWYVLADLHDRLGNPVKARNIFEIIMQIDSKFADVAERLSTLGA